MGRRIAVIGGGFSGAALALEICALGGQVIVIDKGGGFGRGLAYSTPDPAHLLNVPAGRMSVLPDAPDDFVSWLRARTGAADPDAYVSRGIYGDYLGERMRITRDFAAVDAIKLVAGEAIGLDVQESGVRVALAGGDAIDADAAVLALGHQPPAPPFDVSGLGPGAYPHDPWRAEAIDAIAPDADVLLVGTGLTMIDVVRSLTRRPRSGRIVALSRHGLAPRPQARHASHLRAPLELPLQVSAALRTLRREARAAEQQGETWQDTMNRARAAASAHWRELSLEQRARFLRHARAWWEVHRHRAAPEIAAELAALQRAGGLELIAGRVAEAAMRGGRVALRYRPRGQRRLESLVADVIVNCTGACPDPRRWRDPLTQRLLERGMASAHPTGLGFAVDDYGALIGADGVGSTRLYALGPPTQGAFWEITAVPEIRRVAAELAQRLAGGG